MKKILKTQINEEVIKEEEDKKNRDDNILEGRYRYGNMIKEKE